jgi:hypothetical protein
MPIDDGKLRAYLDQALSPEEQALVEQQVTDRPEVQEALARLEQAQQNVAAYLAAIEPSPEQGPEAGQAWRGFQSRLSGQSMPTKTNWLEERINSMVNQPFIKRYQPLIILFTVAVIIAVALSFAPVRTMASNLLKVFRVQTVQVVPVDKEDMEALRNNPNLERLIDQLEPQLEVAEDSEPEKVDSLDEADDKVNFQITQITALPEDTGAPTITVLRQKVVQLQLDKELLEAVFEAAEIEVELPDSLNDEPLVITHPDTVEQRWHREGEKILEFIQMPAPSIEYPDGLDLDELGVAGLQLLGMSAEEAAALSATIDWANTMVLPVPNNGEVEIQEVALNGTRGLLFTNPNSEDDRVAVVWNQNGMSYFLAGKYPAGEIVDMAKSVQ